MSSSSPARVGGSWPGPHSAMSSGASVSVAFPRLQDIPGQADHLVLGRALGKVADVLGVVGAGGGRGEELAEDAGADLGDEEVFDAGIADGQVDRERICLLLLVRR